MKLFNSLIDLKGVVFASFVLLAGCGGSDSGDDIEKLDKVTNVSGNYTLITSAISVECTDGSTNTDPAIALSGAIVHSGNKVEFFNDNGGEVVGLTIIEGDSTDGVIESDGKFVMTSVSLIQIEGIDGNLTVNYNLSGYFNDTGWSGDYQYSVFLHSTSISCTYTSPFYGTKS